MSDDGRVLGEDDGADLFESDPEDQGTELGNSVDLPALSLDTLYSKPDNVGDDCAAFDHSGCEMDLSGAAGFDISARDLQLASPSPLPTQIDTTKAEDEGGDQPENEVIDNGTEHSDIEAGGEEAVATEMSMPQCGRPIRVSDSNHAESSDGKENSANSVDAVQEVCHDDDASIQNNDSKPSLDLATIDTPDGIRSPSPLLYEDKADGIPSESAPALAQTICKENECSDTTSNLPANKIEVQQQTEVVKTAPPVTSKSPVYTVEALFPVVYERSVPVRGSPTENAQVVPMSTAAVSDKMPSRDQIQQQKTSTNADKSLAPRLASFQSQLGAARAELKYATRTFKLQLSMAQTDNKKLSQRNARLKNQLAVATADLQRSNAEMAKLKTENELYAAKLPLLQAELLKETSQVDETQAQSVQTQLALTQLKARSHVLQTRNLALEAQNNKLTQQVRELQQLLQRKTVALQQQTEKATKLESDMNEQKTTHIQEKLDWKSRMTSALQRFERDKTKVETALKSQGRKELREATDRADKASKKRQAAESSAAKLEAQLKHCKHELSSANEVAQHHINEVRTLEALLRKAHRTEATLRNDVAACKTKLRALQEEKKRRLARPAAMQPHHRRRLEQQIPVELLLPLTESDDEEDEEEDNQEERCCSHCLTLTEAFESQSPRCSECPQLKDQIQQLQQDLRRIRSLHTAELHAQASVLDALLLQQKRQLAVAVPQM